MRRHSRLALIGLLLVAGCSAGTEPPPPPPPAAPPPLPPPPPPPPAPPNSWVRRDSLPGGGVAGASSFVLGNRMYVAAGVRNDLTNSVYRYDPSQNAWQQLPPIPMSPRANGIGFAIGGYGYMGLGYYFGGSSFTYFQDLWRLDTATTFWTRMADFPGEARAFAAVFVIGDKAYVTGGSSANHIDTWQYRPATNTWTQKADFPGTCNARTTAFTIGTTGYIGLGLGVNGGCKEFWAYDTTANSWAKVDSFPGTTRYDAIGFAIGDTGFVVGGVSSPHSATDVWIYRASANAWSQLPTTYPGPALMQMVAAVIAGRIFVGTGTNSDTGGPDSRFADFWEYIR